MNAQELYAPVGSCLGSFDTFTHFREASLRTFPHPDGHLPGVAAPSGMTLMPDGRVAVLLDDLVTPQHPNVVYFLKITPQPAAFEVVGQPIVPRYSARKNALFIGGPAIDADQQFVFLVRWQDESGGGSLFHHALMRTPFSGGEAILIKELPQTTPGIASHQAGFYSALVAVRKQGSEPDGYLLSLNGPVGARPFFMYVDTAGNLVREIFLDEYLPTPENPCFYGRFAVATSGDDFLAFACADRQRNICMRFDRFGKFKGAWNFSAALPGTPWLPPDPFETFVQLPSGDLLTGSLFARYILETGDRSGSTWRYFVLRPPTAFGAPVCVVAPEAIDFGTVPQGGSPSAELKIRNSGSAELIVSSVSIRGPGSSAYRFDGPSQGSLPPSFGLAGSTDVLAARVHFSPATPGKFQAEVVVESNDPVTPRQRVPLSGFQAPPGYADTVVFDTATLFPWPNEAKAFALDAGGTRVNVLFEMVDGTDRSSRVVEIPIARSPNGKVASLNAPAALTRVETMARSRFGMALAADGTLWYGPTFTSQKTVFQRKPDGTVYSQELTVGNGAPYDLDFTPDGKRLLVGRGLSRIYRFALKPRADGFQDLVYDGRLFLDHPPGFYSFAVWPDPTDNFLVYEASGELKLALGLDRFWYREGPPLYPPLTIVVATGLSVADLARDPATGDLLYLDSNRRLHRLDGLRALLPPNPPAQDFRLTEMGFNWSTHMLTLGWYPWAEQVAVESSTNLIDWKPASELLDGTSTLVPLPTDGAPHFWRARGNVETR